MWSVPHVRPIKCPEHLGKLLKLQYTSATTATTAVYYDYRRKRVTTILYNELLRKFHGGVGAYM